MINAVAGGTLATAVCFFFPALMFRQAVLLEAHQSNLEANFAMVLMAFGSFFGIIGVWQAVVETYS